MHERRCRSWYRAPTDGWSENRGISPVYSCRVGQARERYWWARASRTVREMHPAYTGRLPGEGPPPRIRTTSPSQPMHPRVGSQPGVNLSLDPESTKIKLVARSRERVAAPIQLAFGAGLNRIAPIASHSDDKSSHSKRAGADHTGSAPAHPSPVCFSSNLPKNSHAPSRSETHNVAGGRRPTGWSRVPSAGNQALVPLLQGSPTRQRGPGKDPDFAETCKGAQSSATLSLADASGYQQKRPVIPNSEFRIPNFFISSFPLDHLRSA